MLPCLLFEDDDLLVVNKPPGLNTHAPGPFGGEGLYDWLRHREPRWARLAIIHRLDKDTSGVLVFSKSPRANRSLTEQFTQRAVRKTYVLLTDRPVPEREVTARSVLVRAGEKYRSRPVFPGGELAETRFYRPAEASLSALPCPAAPVASEVLWAEPRTGRTHQIRVHAADLGFPILGDTLYGGTPSARLFLHAAELTLTHPATGKSQTFRAPPAFAADARLALRLGLLDPEGTTAWRAVHGASDGHPGWYVDRFGDYLLSQSESPLGAAQGEALAGLAERLATRGACHKILTREVRGPRATVSPQVLPGASVLEWFAVRENGLAYETSFSEGYSVGLFLDQRENRRRLLREWIAAEFPLPLRAEGGRAARRVLNAFAYTCAFSVCAAMAGARTTSLDLSRRYLEWGRRNFTGNGIDPAGHDFIYGDVFDWLRRLARRSERFDVVLLDPPTFSRSKASGPFRVEKDFGKLVTAALGVLSPAGVLFASSNAAEWSAPEFLAVIETSVAAAQRTVLQRHYAPQPPDFPISRGEPAYLKTAWLRIG